MLSVGNHSYVYDGDGARVQQTVSSVVTDYLLDLQPGLVKVVAATSGANVERYVHGPRGIFGIEDNVGDWSWMVQDGLGSVRMQLDDTLGVDALGSFAPYGDPFGEQGSFDVPFGFTGEQTDGNSQVYLRARYYTPGMGVFVSLDPYEGVHNRPMSLNGYNWVEGNTPNAIDPIGKQTERDCSRDKLTNCEFEGSECEIICLFADQWLETAREINVNTLTNLSDEAFAAMIAAKFIFEDATHFNNWDITADDRYGGLGREIVTEIGRIPLLRGLWEKFGPTGEISYGPGNIPLAQAENAAEWWQCTAPSLGLDPSIFNSGYYSPSVACYGVGYGGMICTEDNFVQDVIFELSDFSNQHHPSWDRWLAVTILQSAYRAREFEELNDTSDWVTPRTIDDNENQLSGYIIALAQLSWTATDRILYDLSRWESKGGAYEWAEAVLSVRNNTRDFWPELQSLDVGGYRPWTEQELRRLEDL